MSIGVAGAGGLCETSAAEAPTKMAATAKPNAINFMRANLIVFKIPSTRFCTDAATAAPRMESLIANGAAASSVCERDPVGSNAHESFGYRSCAEGERWRHSAAGKLSGQCGPACGNSTLDGSEWAAQLGRGGFVGLALDQAQDDSGSLYCGQAVDLVVQDQQRIAVELVTSRVLEPLREPRWRRGARGCAGGRCLRRQRSSLHFECDAVEPAREALSRAERGRLLNEDEKDGLKGVVDVVGVVKPSAADAQDHRAVACQDFFPKAVSSCFARKRFEKLSPRRGRKGFRRRTAFSGD